MNTQQSRYNILVIGKTGVGKSSFVNYLLGKNIAESGTGRPVTERGFHQYDDVVDGFPVTLYDSWGLEANKYKEWMEIFSKELNERGVEKPASEWFHSVFYCISGGGHRVEDADIEILQFLNNARYPVSVILTKCDMLSEEQEKEMIAAIHKSNDSVHVIPMSSGGKNRSGVIEPFGLEDIKKQAKEDFFISIAARIPDHLRSILKKELENLKINISKTIENNPSLYIQRHTSKHLNSLSGKNIDEHANNELKTIFEESFKKVSDDLFLELKEILTIYSQPLKLMNTDMDEMLHHDFQNISLEETISSSMKLSASLMAAASVATFFFPPATVWSLILASTTLLTSYKIKRKLRLVFEENFEQGKKQLENWIDNLEKAFIEVCNKNGNRGLLLPAPSSKSQ